MRRIVLFITIFALALGLLPAATAAASQGAERKTVIVVLRDGTGRPADVAAEMARRHGGRSGFVYEHALRGFTLEVPARAAAAIARDRRVASVEFDQVASIAAQETPTGLRRISADSNGSLDIDGVDDVRVDVDVAVIDTGVDMDHPDLNVVGGTDCAGGKWWQAASCEGDSGDDGNGHGSHVAGTIGAIDDGNGVVGVAPGARIHAVRVLDHRGSGQISWIVAGIDWVTERANIIDVANMSLGCECSSSAMNAAIASSVDAGIVYVAAAGNSDKNTSTFSPANHPDVIAVSALADFNGLPGGGASPTCRNDVDDTLADFSNWGSAVDIAAPGVCITSTWRNGGYNTISGTSMASPHVAGAAALLTSGGSTMAPQNVKGALQGAGNLLWTDDSGDGVKEKLLDVASLSATTIDGPAAGGGGTAPPPNEAPTAAFTFNCVDLDCTFTDASGDGDGSIASRSWDFGDGGTSTDTNPLHTYGAEDTYTVTLTVTDDDGATDVTSQDVTVSEPVSDPDPPAGGITLQVSPYKVKGVQHVDLTWSGTTVTDIDVYRDGSNVATTTNDGAHTDNIDTKGGGVSYSYTVCEAGTGTCSNAAIAAF